LKIRKGVIRDATLIPADPEHASADLLPGDNAKTRRNKEGRIPINPR
jgi:IS5 family transposase